MQFQAGVMWIAGGILVAAMIATFAFRKRPWSRTLAIVAAVMCFQATMVIIPPAAALVGEGNRVDWDTLTADILGRIIFSVLLVSGVRGQWIWRAARTASSIPWDGNEDNA